MDALAQVKWLPLTMLRTGVWACYAKNRSDLTTELAALLKTYQDLEQGMHDQKQVRQGLEKLRGHIVAIQQAIANINDMEEAYEIVRNDLSNKHEAILLLLTQSIYTIPIEAENSDNELFHRAKRVLRALQESDENHIQMQGRKHLWAFETPQDSEELERSFL